MKNIEKKGLKLVVTCTLLSMQYLAASDIARIPVIYKERDIKSVSPVRT